MFIASALGSIIRYSIDSASNGSGLRAEIGATCISWKGGPSTDYTRSNAEAARFESCKKACGKQTNTYIQKARS